MNKVHTLDQFIAQLEDGMTIGIGGWGARRKPMDLVRAICRSPLKDLTIVSYGGPDVGLLCREGKIKELVFGFVSLDLIPLEAHFRQARQNGNLKNITELDEGMLQWGLRAAAMRLPFLPTKIGFGTDILKHNSHIKTITSPYSDKQELVAMPAIPLDAALIHVNKADKKGNTQIFGPDPFFDDLFARAATNTFVSSEKIVDTDQLGGEQMAIFNRFERNFVTGVIECPGGAHPTSCAPDYGFDLEHLKNYSAQVENYAEYKKDFIDVNPSAYHEAVGGLQKILSISLPRF